MAQLLFVHGVSVRKDAAYQPAVDARDRRFTEAFGGPLAIKNSYWGEFGADPKWRLACIPKFGAKYQSLSVDMAARNDLVLEAAKQDFPAVVGSLSVVALEDAQASGNAARLREEERFWAGAAAYAELSNRPAWLDAVDDDDAFFAKLRAEAEALAEDVDLGVVDSIKSAAGKLAGGFSNIVNSPFGKIGREKVTPRLAIFVGDVFRYLKDGAGRAAIRKIVLADLEECARAAADGAMPLVVAGHSMGGVILYDLLSDPLEMAALGARLGQPLQIDVFLTIGSQIALFEELKVFAASDDQYGAASAKPHDKVPRPACVQHWWNVFDKMDVLSFLAGPVFDGAEDFAVDTVAGVADAHSAYFLSMLFYQRLNARLSDAGIVP